MDRPSLLSEVWIAARGHPPRLRRFDQSSSPLQLGAATSRGHIVTWIAVLVEQNAQCDLFWPLDYLSLVSFYQRRDAASRQTARGPLTHRPVYYHSPQSMRLRRCAAWRYASCYPAARNGARA